jgi:hypothetical protein
MPGKIRDNSNLVYSGGGIFELEQYVSSTVKTIMFDALK